MRRRGAIPCLLAMCLLSGGAVADDHGSGPLLDPAGDAAIRRTDSGADGAVSPMSVLPDLVSVVLQGWAPTDPASDRYTGVPDTSDEPDILRIEVRFKGLLNPPGTLGLSGLPYNPFEFGPSPVYGFLELDVDDEDETGGERTPVAFSRYLANVGRFGSAPHDSIGERMVRRAGDADTNFFSTPQFERTGADFALALCGCWSVGVLSEGGDLNGSFDAGEQWVVSGRFLERAQAFDCLSGVFGSSDFGLYDPITEARFTHELGTDETVIELVYPLTHSGAAALLGAPEEPIDFDVSNQFSMAEALEDLILGAESTQDPVCTELSQGWVDQSADEHLDPTEWGVTALFGTAYSVQEPTALYVWTDVGFDEVVRDFNGDERAGLADTNEMLDEISDTDGTSGDADGLVNGQVVIPGYGSAFSLYDLNDDGVIGADDVALMPCNDADLAEPLKVLDFTDVLTFLGAFSSGSSSADLAAPEDVYDFTDVIAFLASFGAGCP